MGTGRDGVLQDEAQVVVGSICMLEYCWKHNWANLQFFSFRVHGLVLFIPKGNLLLFLRCSDGRLFGSGAWWVTHRLPKCRAHNKELTNGILP